MGKKKYYNIGNPYEFKISPTMAAIIKEQGEMLLKLDGKYYVLVKESKYNKLLKATHETK